MNKENSTMILALVLLIGIGLVIAHPPIYERILSPGISTCYRCGRPWISHDRYFGLIGVRYHITGYGEPLPDPRDFGIPMWVSDELNAEKANYSQGCFPLCESCWKALTPKQRLPYYRRLVDDWHKWDESEHEKEQTESKWPEIREAVLGGR